jgi:CheY-like chemotaxis protein
MLLTGKHILIVEDNVLNRVVYQMTLVMNGAITTYDRWGDRTLRLLEGAQQWDLIVLDLMLPRGMSGFDIFEEIRQLPEYDAVPIIAISASEPSVAIPQARKLGFSGFISKPINESIFADQIAQIIAGEQIWYDGTLLRS